MAPYQERADPQTIGTLPLMVSPGQIPEALKEHAVQLGKYGPPPPNFSVAHKRRQPPAFWKNRDYWPTSPWYRELSDVGEGNWYHPLSPVGLALNPKLDPEPDRPSAPKPGYKKKAPGWFDPPLIYKAGDWTWQHFKTWQGALADSLTVRGYRAPGNNNITEAIVNRSFQQTNTKSYKNDALYHPGDEDLLIFEGERECSYTLRSVGEKASLVVVCPLILKDGHLWDRFWDKTNRPPIIARWSTGPQGLYPAVILGCLPGPDPRDRKLVFWFSLHPTVNDKINSYHQINHDLFDVRARARAFGFPPLSDFGPRGPDVFVWALVYLHRNLAFGLALSAQEIPYWLYQFGNHLLFCFRLGKKSKFVYNKAGLEGYNGRYMNRYSMTQLTGLVLNRHFKDDDRTTRPEVYAKEWDDAWQAYYDYTVQLDHQKRRQPTKYNRFKALFQKAARPPFVR